MKLKKIKDEILYKMYWISKGSLQLISFLFVMLWWAITDENRYYN